MRITIIPSSKLISINGEGLLNIQQDLSWIPLNIHAVQWYDTWGEIEYTDGTPNQKIEELSIFEQAIEDYNNEVERIENKKEETARDYWEELRVLRNQRLTESDWTQVADAPLTEEHKDAWKNYRQELRDLPQNIIDPKPIVLDPNHSSWTIKPITIRENQ
jgi:hypothetical protein